MKKLTLSLITMISLSQGAQAGCIVKCIGHINWPKVPHKLSWPKVNLPPLSVPQALAWTVNAPLIAGSVATNGAVKPFTDNQIENFMTMGDLSHQHDQDKAQDKQDVGNAHSDDQTKEDKDMIQVDLSNLENDRQFQNISFSMDLLIAATKMQNEESRQSVNSLMGQYEQADAIIKRLNLSAQQQHDILTKGQALFQAYLNAAANTNASAAVASNAMSDPRMTHKAVVDAMVSADKNQGLALQAFNAFFDFATDSNLKIQGLLSLYAENQAGSDQQALPAFQRLVALTAAGLNSINQALNKLSSLNNIEMCQLYSDINAEKNSIKSYGGLVEDDEIDKNPANCPVPPTAETATQP